MTITADQVEQLLSLDKLETILSATEPLGEVEFTPDGSEKIEFTLKPGWADGLSELPGTAKVEAEVTVNGTKLTLSKDALLQATSFIGITQQYATKTPATLITPQLNYWFSHTQNKVTKFLTVKGEAAVALVKGSVSPVSNIKLLEVATSKLKDLYGDDTQILADYKLHHDLRQTNFRLIVPEKARTLKTNRSEAETWSTGLDIQNSLTAESGLRARGYLFAWICTNGMTSTHASSGTWSRKNNPSEDQALEWAEASIESILGGLEHELDNVEALSQVKIEGEVNHTLQDVFERYKVPAQARSEIIAQVIEADDLTMFGVHAAITRAANHPDLNTTTVSRLLEIGGDLPATATNRCSSCHRLPI